MSFTVLSFDASENLLTSRGGVTYFERNDDGETGYLYYLNHTNKKTRVFLCHYRQGCKATLTVDDHGVIVKRSSEGMHRQSQ